MQLRTAGPIVAALAVLASAWFFFSYLGRSPWPGPGEPFLPTEEPGAVLAAADYRFSGPYTHDNLTVYLVHGTETLDAATFLTLREALEQKKAVVHETGSVNQLSIENLSPGEEVYVQSGDIVKGGKQDRTLPHDAVIAAGSGPVPIDSFCVEAGRWAKRGDESSAYFSLSSSSVSVSGIKRAVAAPGEASQAAVWSNVAQTQQRLSAKLGTSVQAKESASSLQLSLEHPAVRERIGPYADALAGVVADQADALGYVAVVNGRVLSADVYASRALFRKLWPKLLEGSATEAFLEANPTVSFAVPDEAAVRQALVDAERGASTTEAVTQRTYVRVRTAEKGFLFDSCDRSRRNLVLHRSYLAR